MADSTQQQPQMGLIDFARMVIDALEISGVDYMLAGALAVAAWAEARSTQDVDLVVYIPFENISLLSQELEKRDMLVHAPEDLILNKLHYFGLSQQPKHVRDIISILLAIGDQLDMAYIEDWAARLGLTALWGEVFDQALDEGRKMDDE